MFWIQSGIAFLVWVAFGAVQARRSAAIRRAVGRRSRGQRIVGGIALLFGSVALLFGALALLAATNGLVSGRLNPVGWLALALVGCAFVQMQILGVGMFASLAMEARVTEAHSEASTNQVPRDLLK